MFTCVKIMGLSRPYSLVNFALYILRRVQV